MAKPVRTLPARLPARTDRGADATNVSPASPSETTAPATTGELVPSLAQTSDVAAYGLRSTGRMLWPARAADVLTADIEEADVDILPTGEVYYSQIQYRRRLAAAFGPGNWRMVSVGEPVRQGTSLIQKWLLLVYGCEHAETYGEAEYHEDNERMTWATAWEAAKSNALMRLCKDLGIASECWDRRWTEQWKARWAVHVFRRTKSKPEWRRIDAPPFFDETGPTAESPNADKAARSERGSRAPEPPPTSAPSPAASAGPATAAPLKSGTRTISEAQVKRLFAIVTSRAATLGVDRSVVETAATAELKRMGFAHPPELTRQPYDALVAFVEQWTPPAGADDADADEAETYYVSEVGDEETGTTKTGRKASRWRVTLAPCSDTTAEVTAIIHDAEQVQTLLACAEAGTPVVLTKVTPKTSPSGTAYLDVDALEPYQPADDDDDDPYGA